MREIVQASPPKRYLQFSLRALLIAMVAVAAGFSIMTAAKARLENERLHSELKRIRREVGELTIEKGDELQLHVVGVPTREDMVWRWRVYVPETETWTLHYQGGAIRTSGLLTSKSYNSGTAALDKGEQTILLALRRDPENDSLKWYLYSKHGHTEFSVSPGFEALSEGWSQQTSGVTNQLNAEDRNRVELLRLLRRPQNSAPPQPGVTESGQGILLWMERLSIAAPPQKKLMPIVTAVEIQPQSPSANP